jgi:hypothetical protein
MEDNTTNGHLASDGDLIDLRFNSKTTSKPRFERNKSRSKRYEMTEDDEDQVDTNDVKLESGEK